MKNNIEVKSLYKHYADEKRVYEVLSNVNFIINQNGLYGLKGESGSGKTTLLKLLSRKIDFDEGTIIINNQNIESLNNDEWISFRKENLTIMPQENFFDNNHTVKANIKFLFQAENIYFSNEKFEALMSDFNIPKRKVKFLSKGEKQKALFIYTILKAKKVLILDEPTSSLDSYSSQKLWEYLIALSHDHLIIVSSNKEEEINNYCYQHIVIKDKKVIVEENEKVKSCTSYEFKMENGKQTKKNSFRYALQKLTFFHQKNLLTFLILMLLSISYLLIIGLYLNQIYYDDSKHIVYIQGINNIEDCYQKVENKTIDYATSYKNFYEVLIKNEDRYHQYSESYMIYSFTKDDKDLYYKGRKPEALNEIAISKKSRFEIGDKVFINNISGNYEFLVVGLLEYNCAIISPEKMKQISNSIYIIDDCYLSFDAIMQGTYKISYEDIESSKIIIRTYPERVLDIDNKKIRYNNQEMEVNLEVIDNLTIEETEIIIGKDILNILLVNKNDQFIVGRIEGFNNYIDIKKTIGDDYQIVYNYLNSDEVKPNQLNSSKLKELILYLVTSLVLLIGVRVLNFISLRKTSFIIAYNHLYTQKERLKIYLYERLVIFISFLICFCIFLLVSSNIHLLQSISQSGIYGLYYLTIIIIIASLFTVSRGISDD